MIKGILGRKDTYWRFIMRIAYCDDEKTQYIFLKELTDKWESASGKSCDIVVYASAEEMLFENQESFSFDFIILDIELGQMNGVDLARKIRKIDKKVTIAFLSNSREYVFEGYEVGAARYLMKPLTKQQLFPLLDMVLKSMEEEKSYIILGSAGEKVKLIHSDICYIEALGHYIQIHMADRNLEVKKNINEIAKELGKDFIATHRSYLVNVSQIERITRTDCILSSGEKVPISRNSYDAVNRAFINYYKGGEL